MINMEYKILLIITIIVTCLMQMAISCQNKQNQSHLTNNDVLDKKDTNSNSIIEVDSIPRKKANRIEDYLIPKLEIDSCCNDICVKVYTCRNTKSLIKYFADNNATYTDTTYYYGIDLNIIISEKGKQKEQYLITRNKINEKLRIKNIERFHLGYPFVEKINADFIICSFSLCQADTDICYYFQCIYHEGHFRIKEVKQHDEDDI